MMPSKPLFELWEESDDNDPLQMLRATVEMSKEVSRREAVAVRRARMQGLTWTEIARAMGVSRQAVHRKYGGSRFTR